MTLHPRPVFEVPQETARVARAAFPKGNIYMRIRDRFGVFFEDEQFASLFSERGQPAFSPRRLALISIMQFVEDLSDRQAADAIRGRIDWKYILGLELEDSGIDHSILSEFRQRLITGSMEVQLLDTLLATLAEHDLLKKRGKQRTDSTHVIAAVRSLNQLETIGETMRAALNMVAIVAPDWLQRLSSPEWYDRYAVRIEEFRLPKKKKEREDWIQAVGDDGIFLLNSICESEAHQWLWEVPSVQILRQVWMHRFYYLDGELKLRKAKDLPPASIRFDSPYDAEAHYGKKRSVSWLGYKVHLTETCDDDQPHLITHVETTVGSQTDANMTESIHAALAKKDCLPDSHLADAGYIDADQLVDSENNHAVDLVGPTRPNVNWQTKENTGYSVENFALDWHSKVATCPQGVSTTSPWKAMTDANGNDAFIIRFPAKACRDCQSRSLCTRRAAKPRSLTVRPQAQHEALQKVRQQQQTQSWKKQYAKRAGVEGTISQAVRSFGLRDSRYLGLAKTHLQHVLTATAINLTRLDAWFTGKKRAGTRVSHFTALRPLPG